MSLRRVLFGFLALTLVLSACGDGGGGDDEADNASDDASDTASDNADSDTGDGDSDTGDGDTGDGGIPAGAFGDEDCAVLLSIAVAPLAALGSGGEGFDAEGFEEIRSQLDAVAEDAPDDVADSLEVIKATTDEVAELMEDVDAEEDFTDPDFQQAFNEALELLGSEEYTEASEEVSAFATEECNLTAGANN